MDGLLRRRTRALPDDLRRMEEIVSAMERNLEGHKASEDLDANLHILIARATHNIVWLHLMQSIFDAMREFQRGVWRAVYLVSDDQTMLYGHHRAIYEAIRDHDPERARAEMLKHLTFAEQRATTYLRQSQEAE